MIDEPDLVALLDDEARALLSQVKEEGTLSVMDRVRVFVALTNYAETRLKIAPPDKGKSKFGELRERLDREPPKRKPRANGRAAGDRGNSDEAEATDAGSSDF